MKFEQAPQSAPNNNETGQDKPELEQKAEDFEQALSNGVPVEEESAPAQESAESSMNALKRVTHIIRTELEIKSKDIWNSLSNRGKTFARAAVLAGAMAPSFLAVGCGEQEEQGSGPQRETQAESVEEGGMESQHVGIETGGASEAVQNFMERHNITVGDMLESSFGSYMEKEDGTIVVEAGQNATHNGNPVEAYSLSPQQQEWLDDSLALEVQKIIDKEELGASDRSVGRSLNNLSTTFETLFYSIATPHESVPQELEEEGTVQEQPTQEDEKPTSSGQTGTDYPIDF